ncbi:UNVERIFIED_ORG: hypothetical protein CLV66_10528 [Actinomadura viridilutea]|nr:SAVED domain-containing protein [Actinomadura rubrobrunea]
MPDRPTMPRLRVVGSAARPPGSLREAFSDGSAWIGLGSAVAAGFGVEAIKSIATGDARGRWWFILLFAVGLALIIFGFRKRGQLRRTNVGIVATVFDARRSLARAEQLDAQAETYSQNTCQHTFKTSFRLPDDLADSSQLVDALAEETLAAITMAERLTPGASRINLIPTMPLHIAFWFGAKLGHSHARQISVHAIRERDGEPSYFPATSLRAVEHTVEPLILEPLRTISESPVAALALDLQGRGDQFFDQVVAACHQHRIGRLLPLRSPHSQLSPDEQTFTGVVEQTCRAWRDAPLPDASRTARHAIFLSGPVAISLTLGARLASNNHGRWTAFTLNQQTGEYEPFPPSPKNEHNQLE